VGRRTSRTAGSSQSVGTVPHWISARMTNASPQDARRGTSSARRAPVVFASVRIPATSSPRESRTSEATSMVNTLQDSAVTASRSSGRCTPVPDMAG
jgi:hypothetical protein